jgi:peroxiredoxin
MFTRRKDIAVPEVEAEAPEFNLPSAQGGQLRLGMRTAFGPVVVVFFRGAWSEEDVAYFKALAEKEDEINHARASVVAIGAIEPDEAREFVRATGIKSYVLYDYVRITSQQWGLLEKNKEHGYYARPAVFIVDSDRKVVHAWTNDLPLAEEILAKVSEITGLPKPPEEKPEEEAAEGEEKPKKMSAEERERIKAERRAAREAGKSVKTGQQQQPAEEASEERKPKKMSAEERERIKAKRRAAREAGKSVKTGKREQSKEEPEAGESGPQEATEEASGEQSAETQAASEPEKSGDEE